MFVAASATVAAPASAEPFELVLKAGVACEDFALRINSTGTSTDAKVFTDKSGTVVRMLRTGTGDQLTFTNVSTGESLALASNGSVTQTILNADGTVLVQNTGHNVVILFPEDKSPGPSATLYVGRVVIAVDKTGSFEVVSSSGRTVDLCAELSA